MGPGRDWKWKRRGGLAFAACLLTACGHARSNGENGNRGGADANSGGGGTSSNAGGGGGLFSGAGGGPCAPQFVGQIAGAGDNMTEFDPGSVGTGSEANAELRRELVVEQTGDTDYVVDHGYVTRRSTTAKTGAFIVGVTNTTTQTRCNVFGDVTLRRADDSLVGGTLGVSVEGSIGVAADGTYYSSCLYPGEKAFIRYGLAWEFESYDPFVESQRISVYLTSARVSGDAPGARFVASNWELGSEGALRMRITNTGLGPGRFSQLNGTNVAGTYVSFDAGSEPISEGGLMMAQGTPDILRPGESAMAEEPTTSLVPFTGSSATFQVRLRFYDANVACGAY